MSDLSFGLSTEALKKYISTDLIHLTCVDSTNTYAKALTQENSFSKPVAIVADSQNAGRGRLGRSFFCDEGTGLYMSLLIFPNLTPCDMQLITTAAAAALCRAIEELSGISPSIKWVNDLYLGDKKIAGILTEGSFDSEFHKTRYAVLGIGVNIFAPKNGFPNEIKNIASSIFPETYPVCSKKHPFFREALAGKTIDLFMEYYDNITQKPHFEDYKSRMFLTGQEVDVITPLSKTRAKVIDLLPDFSLLVKYPTGKTEALVSGEVSLKLK